MDYANLAGEVQNQGYALTEDVLSAEEVERLRMAVAEHQSSGTRTKSSGGIYAIRNLLDVPAVRDLMSHPRVIGLVRAVLGEGAFAVRGIFFDKTPDANWKVVWHQDLSIAVQEQRQVPEFGPWSVKAGAVHVQPPAEILERMVTLRLHLDSCTRENGALRVIPGTHQSGKLEAAAIADIRATEPETCCELELGGCLLMKPLILHASSPATVPRHRRVVHLEFAAEDLPSGLEWRDRVQLPTGMSNT